MTSTINSAADLRAKRARLMVPLQELSKRTGYPVTRISTVLNEKEVSAPLMEAVGFALSEIEAERAETA